ITDEEGEPLAGVSVIRAGKFSGTVTDNEGFYSIRARKGDHLQFRYIGMHPTDVAVGDNKEINVSMINDAQHLQEVQVLSTGYQSLPRERATGAFSTLSAEDLKKIPTANVVHRMEGQVPGMKVSVLSGDRSFAYSGGALQSANSSTRTVGNNDYDMAIRGVSTLRGEKMPLLVVDGVICDFDISSIDPNTIENVTILKDAAAASIWGSRAANGVIVVTTKKGQKGQRPQVSFGVTLTTQDKPDFKSLNRLSSAATLEYEKDIVDRGYIYASTPYDYYSAQTVLPEGTRLALKLKNGEITQSDYDARVNELSAVDNFGQIKDSFMRRAFSQQYNASVSGGSTNSTYFYSMSYAKENPYAKGDSGSRFNVKLSNAGKLVNWATLTTNFAGTFLKYKNNGMDIRTILGGTTKVMPYTTLVDANGNGVEQDVYDPTWVSTLGPAYKRWTYNYLEEVQLGNHTQRSDNYSANINLLIPILWGISSQTTYALERGNTTVKNWYDPETYQVRNMMNYYTPVGATTNTLGIRNGGLSDQHSRDRNWTFREQLNYDGHYSGIHRINAIAGVELRQTYVEQGSSTIWGYNPDTGIEDVKLDYSTNQSYNCIT
ncbi:MAG: TonB-dependent receptor plug domain-containing protein, partial [Duncaniella sp.]|nr:TonB-dependent receptor plug domain-containing protein [Duncaniella sp.]